MTTETNPSWEETLQQFVDDMVAKNILKRKDYEWWSGWEKKLGKMAADADIIWRGHNIDYTDECEDTLSAGEFKLKNLDDKPYRVDFIHYENGEPVIHESTWTDPADFRD